ncbi:MAG: D-glycero-beta-D-manno-heptose-7-phosphate kinase [Deltaproteobacteria bacterium]|nr:D-glycero-beta-D-manno-heptose-7-phosphate kinase [Deltaproteobacteria bacterium]
MQAMGLHNQGNLLREYIDRFSQAKIMVIGDIIMDEYVWGEVARISPEAPVPVVEVRGETKMLGGAANVVNNMAALGARPILCGVIGEDKTGREIIEKIAEKGLLTDGIVIEQDRPTSIKTRVVAQGQQIVRFDRENRSDITTESITKVLDFMETCLDDTDAIVVADYGKGVISGALMKGLRELTRDASVMIAVDPKTGNFECYHGVDVITPNHHEAGIFCRFDIVNGETLIRAGKKILHDLNCRSVLITQGKDGMALFERNGEIIHIPTEAKNVFDVTGAGDTVIGALSLGLASGMDLKSAALLSNYAAGIVVGEVGTSVVRAEDLKRVIDGSKWVSAEDLR